MHKMRLLKHLLVRFSGVTERQEYFETKIHKLNSISFRVSKKKMTSSVQRHFTVPPVANYVLYATKTHKHNYTTLN